MGIADEQCVGQHRATGTIADQTVGLGTGGAQGYYIGLAGFWRVDLVAVAPPDRTPALSAKPSREPYITQVVCRGAFVVMGIRRTVKGEPMRHRGAVVANHTSWLDIFTLNAAQRIYFVSKSEVEGWPGIGWLARATGTQSYPCP